MSQTHLRQLHAALTRRGWNVLERRRGDSDVQGSATWEIRRNEDEEPLKIDFAGFGGLGEDIPFEESYACHVRGRPNDLYFRRPKRSRTLWMRELADFVAALDTV